MTDELGEEFSSLRSSILNGMKHGAYCRRLGSRLLQRVIVPSFENLDYFELCEVARAKGQMQAIHLQWEADRDRAAFRSPVERMKHPRPFRPSVSARSVVVADAVFQNVLRELGKLSLPLAVPKHHSGCDGTSHELTLGDFFCGIRLSWWWKIPDDWNALSQPLEELRRISEGLVWEPM